MTLPSRISWSFSVLLLLLPLLTRGFTLAPPASTSRSSSSSRGVSFSTASATTATSSSTSSTALAATAATAQAEGEFLSRINADEPVRLGEDAIIYILMYNAGTPSEEGVHTCRTGTDNDSREVLIAFVDIADAMALADVIAQDATVEPQAVPTPAPYGNMSKAAWEMGITLQVVPALTEFE